MAMAFSCPSSSCSPSIFTHKTYAPITATTFNFASISSLRFTTPSYHKPLSSSSRIVPKLSQTEPVTLDDSEVLVSEPEQPQSAEETLAKAEAKGEEVFAVVMVS